MKFGCCLLNKIKNRQDLPNRGKCALLWIGGEVSLVEEEQKSESEKQPLMNTFGDKEGSFLTPKLLVALLLIAILGVGSGYLFSKKGSVSGINLKGTGTSSSISKGTIVGSDDTKTFRDIAEGVLKTGGINGEGKFHLQRPGGESQNVYLTSSIVDLSQYIDKKVKVWGETQKAKRAGWLMDVGRLEVL